jgi:bifunctional non-homologous end joining protein LigD
MLCQSGGIKLLDDDTLIGELKADGTRIWLIKADEQFYIFGRPRKGEDPPNYTEKLTEVIEAAKMIPAGNFILDGEAVWFNRDRTVFKGSQIRCSTDISAKQKAARLKYPVVMLVFDALSVDGKNIENWAIEDRKLLLEDLLRLTPPTIRPLDYTVTEKRELFEEVVARGEEGLIVKRLGSRYERGRRSPSWLKVKRWYSERVRVVGYTEGTGRRAKFFGSLILAKVDDQGFLRYCGKVGSGFDNAELRKVFRVLREHEIAEELVETPDPHQPVKVDLDITVKFYETTEGGVFRFPSVLKDSRGVNQIHYDGTTLQGRPRPRDLKSLLEMLK